MFGIFSRFKTNLKLRGENSFLKLKIASLNTRLSEINTLKNNLKISKERNHELLSRIRANKREIEELKRK